MTLPTPTQLPESGVESWPIEVRPKTPQEVGEHAARYIEEHGWTQGRYSDGGRVCMFGALNVALAGQTNPFFPAVTPLWFRTADALFGFIGTRDGSDWNDAPERTKAEVLAALRAIR